MALSGGTISSGTLSGSSHGTRSFGSEPEEGDMDLQARMELKRKRRMESNRESAKRSRQRKQQHLDDLSTQVDKLRTTKQQLMAALNITAQSYAAAEAQNSVLRTQMTELESRLCALREIICYMNANQNQCVANAAATTTMNAHPATTFMSGTASCDTFGGATAWNYGSMQMAAQHPIDHLLYQCF